MSRGRPPRLPPRSCPAAGAAGSLESLDGTPCDTADPANAGTLQVTYTPQANQGTDSVSIVCNQSNPVFTVAVSIPLSTPESILPVSVTGPGGISCSLGTLGGVQGTSSATFAAGTSVTFTTQGTGGGGVISDCPNTLVNVGTFETTCSFTVTGAITLDAY
jgi:hypothetical protein